MQVRLAADSGAFREADAGGSYLGRLMSPQDLWVGIDTGFDQSHLCVIDGELNLIADCILTTSATAVIEVLAANGMAKVQSIALEATACSTELVRGLREAGYPAVMYDAGQVSKYLRIRGNKTDRNDALGLAEVAKFGLPALSAVHLKSPEIQRVRAILQLRHKLIEQRVASENMVRSLLRMHGGRLPHVGSAVAFERNLVAEVDRLKLEGKIDLEDQLLPLGHVCINQRRAAQALSRALERWAKQNEQCERFREIPGVGVICAVSFFTAIEDPHRFEKPETVGAYFGLTPDIRQSGKSLSRGRISRRGNKLTRTHLRAAAKTVLSSRTKSSTLKEWGARLAARIGTGKAQIAVARKLAITMLAMWKDNTKFRQPNLEVFEAIEIPSA